MAYKVLLERRPLATSSIDVQSFLLLAATNHAFFWQRKPKVTMISRDAAAEEAVIQFVDDLKKSLSKVPLPVN
jgi:hypothetical protein